MRPIKRLVGTLGAVWIDDQSTSAMAADHLAVRPYIGIAPTGRYDSEGHGRSVAQAFLVESGPDKPELRTHFHTVDQFQYIARGGGTVGRHRVSPGTVHYADRYTPYGPLRNGPEGLAYLTLRATTDMGISFMPEEREELAGHLQEHAIEASGRRTFTLDLTEADGALVEDADGLRVTVAVVDAGANLAMGPAAGSGAFVVVVEGAVDDDQGRHVAGSLAWCGPGESMTATGAGAGARLAWLQLPAEVS
jgi:hypothetical protein